MIMRCRDRGRCKRHRIAITVLRRIGILRDRPRDNILAGNIVLELGREIIMVGHFVLHAYRSWNADNPRGYVNRGHHGILAPDEGIARYRNRSAAQPAVEWDGIAQALILTLTNEICSQETWRLHGIAITATHIHAVTSKRGSVELAAMQHRLKRLLGKDLSQRTGKRGKRWFSRGGQPTRVRDSKHLEYLLRQYLPQQGGLYWCEGMAEPQRTAL